MNNESSQKADKLKFKPFCDFVIIPLITNKGAYASHKIIGSFGESAQIIIEKYYHARKVYYIRNRNKSARVILTEQSNLE